MPFTCTFSRATEPLQLVPLHICVPLEDDIGGGQYMALVINDDTKHSDEHMLKYKLEAIEKLKEWKALREQQSGK
jgi:hypothetical protein